MATDRRDSLGCWTCRIRRKRCDGAVPVCRACDALEIRCHHDQSSKPAWMDGGDRQQQMAQSVKAEIKSNARRRRGRRKIESIARVIYQNAPDGFAQPNPERSSPANSGSLGANTGLISSKSTSEIQLSGNLRSETVTPSSDLSPSEDRTLQQAYRASVENAASPSDEALPADLELSFIMAYLDYVFPVMFPFYRPSIREGGRSWLLSSLLKNKCLYHSAISLTSYFFSVVKVVPGTDGAICGSYTWESLQRQTELALKKAQHDLHEVSRNGVQGNVLESVSLIQSIVHLLSVEVILGSNENWQFHLDAAALIFEQLLNSSSNDEPSLAFSTALAQIGGRPFSMPKVAIPWSPNQAAFRFSTAMLIFNDIIASTSLEQAPKLNQYYPQLLGAGANPESKPSVELAEFLGCQSWALVAVGEIAKLVAWKKTMRQANELSMPELVKRGAIIEQHLWEGIAALDGLSSRNNQCVPLIDSLISPPCTPDTIRIITQIWAFSALSYLFVSISGWQLASTSLRSHVTQTINLFERLEESPNQIRTLAWPLCVIGCLADRSEELLIKELFTDIGGLETFGTFPLAMSIVENIWHNRSQIDTGSWDLAACLKCLGYRALLV
jgi:hypothetical protein